MRHHTQVTGIVSPWLQKQRFKAVLKRLSGKQVLDYGCDLAQIAAYLPKETVYVGVERDPEVAAQAQTLHPDLQIICGDLATDPRLLSNRLFDNIIMTAVIEHLPNPTDVLKRLNSTLKPKGRLLITTPAPLGEYILRITTLLRLTSREAADEHEKLLSKDALFSLLNQTGFTVIHYERFLFGLNQLIVGEKKDSNR